MREKSETEKQRKQRQWDREAEKKCSDCIKVNERKKRTEQRS